MHVTARAALTYRYEVPTGAPDGRMRQMRTIDVRTTDGQPLMVVQSEDNPAAIEGVLRSNGWSIVSWNGDALELATIAVSAPAQPAAQPQVVVNNMMTQAVSGRNKGLGCGGCLGLIFLVIIFMAIIGSCSHH